MPCNDGGPSYYTSSERLYKMKARLDKATRAACEMARIIREYGEALIGDEGKDLFHKLSKETKKWIEKHDAMDAKRLKLEQEEKDRKRLKKQALCKLSKKEREVLDL
jgi:hypothetical protein